ncbi:MAG: tetratricopeptide repeat protein [Burkholderiales bacterium]
MKQLSKALFLACLLPGAACSAPYLPKEDGVVLERLPLRRADPASAELRQLRAALAVSPRDAAAAAGLARRYFELAMAEGDPRYVGYAVAALRPWDGATDAPPEILFTRALLRQYRHDFAGALEDLAHAARADPESALPRAWRAAIYMVQADYAAARRECEALGPLASELLAAGCSAYVEAATGSTRSAYRRLSDALERRPDAAAESKLWVLTRLAEMAWRLGETSSAERHFRDALALGVADNFLLFTYADFLLEHGRAKEVLSLLQGGERSDTLLLRLALAARALKLPVAERYARALGERFAAAALRGEKLHLQEEARYLLDLKGDAAGALAAARENWNRQREPRDAAVLLEAALAARDPKAAEPVLRWLEESGFESPRLRRLAAQLK